MNPGSSEEETEPSALHRTTPEQHGDDGHLDVRNESTEETSASDPENVDDEKPDGPRGIKRKRGAKRGRYKKKRRALEYSNDVEQYGRLYKANVDEFDLRFECSQQDEVKRRRTKQYGMSRWTRKEQDQLFCRLSRYGRGALRELTTVVPSKSEFEISQYLQLLKTSLNKQLTKKPSRQYLAEYSAIPASLELDSKRLESVARYDYGTLGVIDRVKAAQLCPSAEGEASSNIEFENSVSQLPFPVSPALRLFDLSNWLSLSETIYMNPATEDNWHAIAEAEQTPSILLTPVLELYTIALTLTKRLISASIFQALSRLRANDRWRRKREIIPEVTADDVRTALDIFNMEHDASKYWLRVAERCKLTIYGENKSRLSYDEVADCLAFGYSTREARDLSKANQDFTQEEVQPSDEDVPFLPLDGQEQDDPTIRVHEHANAIDEHNSRQEETQLWATFNQTAPLTNIIQSQAEVAQIAEPPGSSHKLEDFDDWRDRVDYRAEWEQYGYQVPQGEFHKGDIAHIQHAGAGWPEGRFPAQSSPSLAAEDDIMDHTDVASTRRESPTVGSDEERGRGRTPRSPTPEDDASSIASMPRRSARSMSLQRPVYTTQPANTDGGATIPRFDPSSEDEYEPGSTE